MKKKNLLIAALAAVMVSCAAVGFAACEEEDEDYNNLEAHGTIYAEGEQTVTLGISSYATAEAKTTFKESITANDITLSGVLAGKTVSSVTYVSETSVKLVVGGAVTADSTHADDLGTITVARGALANNSTGNCYVKVNFNPAMEADSFSGSVSKYYKSYSSIFSLPYGSFIEENVNSENIIVTAGNAEVSISLVDNEDTNKKDLKIYVKGYNPYYYGEDVYYQYPMAQISANVTTFNVDLYVYIGKTYSYPLVSTTTKEIGDEDRGGADEFGSSALNINECAITSYNSTSDVVSIPDAINGRNVVSINSDVFKNNTTIKSVLLPSTLKELSASQFEGCTNLTHVYFSDRNITTIPEKAFYGCTSLNMITLGATVETIEESAFEGCTSLSNFSSMERTLKIIGDRAFYGCKNLDMISRNDKITSIGKEAFYGCSELSFIELPVVTQIGEAAFKGCTNLDMVELSDELTVISPSLFEDCSELIQFTIGSKVESIGANAFASTGIIFIKIPASVSYIDGNPFKKCAKLRRFDVDSSNTHYTTDNDALLTADKTTLIAYPASWSSGSYTLPSTVVKIEEYAFYGCMLSSIETSQNLTSVGNYAFANCANLTKITFYSELKSIGSYALAYGKSSITISYKGSNWNAVSKGNSWDKDTSYTVTA